MELTKRKQNILASIVDGYIRTGEPVGSKSIAEKAGVSSATVRNEMAELTELGLLEQPHTSAGPCAFTGGLPRVRRCADAAGNVNGSRKAYDRRDACKERV